MLSQARGQAALILHNSAIHSAECQVNPGGTENSSLLCGAHARLAAANDTALTSCHKSHKSSRVRVTSHHHTHRTAPPPHGMSQVTQVITEHRPRPQVTTARTAPRPHVQAARACNKQGAKRKGHNNEIERGHGCFSEMERNSLLASVTWIYNSCF